MSSHFTADSHHHHGNIIKYCHRPFLTEMDKQELARDGAWNLRQNCWIPGRSSRWRITDEAIHLMDEEIINNTNTQVGEDDILWHLGDWAFAPKYDYYRRCREYRDRIKCRHVNLIWGNHDYRSIRDLFDSTYDLCEIDVIDQKIVLCHYAMAVWNKSHRSSWQLYGHSHGGAEKWLDTHMPGRRAVDVGVDSAYKILGKFRPFTFEELRSIMVKRPGFSMDHHVQATEMVD